jgi:hypothetical protein
MTTPRRRLVRPAPVPPPQPQRQLQVQRLRTRLDRERAALARWVARLKRSFHQFEQRQLCIARLERQLARLED